MPKLLTNEERNELDRLKNTRAIRSAVFDAAIVIGAILLVDLIGEFWPQYAKPAIWAVGGLWVGLLFQRYSDWKSVTFLEERLNQDDDERNPLI